MFRVVPMTGEPTFTKFIFSLRVEVSFDAFVRTRRVQGQGKIPERTFGAHAKILQDEPDPHFIVGIREFKSAYAEAADEIASEHATRLRARIGRRNA